MYFAVFNCVTYFPTVFKCLLYLILIVYYLTVFHWTYTYLLVFNNISIVYPWVVPQTEHVIDNYFTLEGGMYILAGSCEVWL